MQIHSQDSSQLIRLDEDDCGWQGVYLVKIQVGYSDGLKAYE